MDSVGKEATPLTAETVVVPESVPPPALLPMATVMLAVELVTVFPKVSCTVTWTAGEMAAPAVVLVGCAVKASFEAAAGVMLNPADVAPVNPPDAAVRV